MNIEELQKIENLHHAYIVSGSAEQGLERVLKILEKRDVRTKGNPDVLTLSFPELLVDSVREVIIPFASLKPIDGKKYLILAFSRANDSAQNALLKAIEESLGHTTFFFCVDAAGHLLPTVRSRCISVFIDANHSEPVEKTEAETFLKENYEKRLARVEKMANYVSKTQDRTVVRSFIKELLLTAHAHKVPGPELRDLLDADKYLRLQGSSVKSILGHLAVSLPRKS